MDKRIAQLLQLVSKTGDRLVIMPENGDPFVLMDLKKYQELIDQPKSRQRKANNAKLMEQYLELWEQTKKDLGVAAPAAPEGRSEPEVVALDPASPADAEEKYYFEPLSSQSEATK